MNTFNRFALVFLGAGIGGVLRHAVNLVSGRLIGPDLPVGTLVINVVGSFAIGLIAGYLALRGHASPGLQLLVVTGIIGGFTTFSAFSLEAALLWERGQAVTCIAYVLLSVLLSIAAVFAGLALIRSRYAV